MKVLLTGMAGFIGAAVARRHMDAGDEVTGIDNLNDYYDPQLKLDRLRTLGLGPECEEWGRTVLSSTSTRIRFIRMDICDEEGIDNLFANNHFDVVIHLAAQAGVRASGVNPRQYVKTNINGFVNVLEGCRSSRVGHLVYASSSSVYGLNGKVPFSEHDPVSHPASIYAATKKSDELLAHVYSHLYGLPATGLRLFTVYGPWGRPDMSPHLFIEAIFSGKELKMYNGGDMWRDFTYVDDVAEGIVRVSHGKAPCHGEWDSESAGEAFSSAPYRIVNIGSRRPVLLSDYISGIERAVGRRGKLLSLPMQPGDIYRTYADTTILEGMTGFAPGTPLDEGLAATVRWFREYYNK